jgi:hypothetical protein
VATCHAEPTALVVRCWDGVTGEELWKHTVGRRNGFRALSVDPDGHTVALAQCDNRTTLNAWDREGTVVWEGELPMESRSAVLRQGDLLVAEDWVVKLTLADAAAP